MSSAKKQIVIDHVHLSSGANNTTLKRQRKIKPPPTLLRHTLKQNLLKKIQEHKQRNEETPGNGSNNGNNSTNGTNGNNLSNEDLSNQFKMSTNYLEQLINKKKRPANIIKNHCQNHNQ